MTLSNSKLIRHFKKRAIGWSELGQFCEFAAEESQSWGNTVFCDQVVLEDFSCESVKQHLREHILNNIVLVSSLTLNPNTELILACSLDGQGVLSSTRRNPSGFNALYAAVQPLSRLPRAATHTTGVAEAHGPEGRWKDVALDSQQPSRNSHETSR